ncbi:Aste57867_8132 [Aphanomyces stellatus]|uniref:Mitochondrial import inner membrane translocase subunit TIM50 n=1 Tax=Aphanomyces stellatus TaxID=120398 RepID=A0A485KJI1_9STRA|nr:hypothetical protein As57867_008102 [Aphanomyces stellatus]VFT85021.1 Aste57867_8132 [Aphanomyces stellatus]
MFRSFDRWMERTWLSVVESFGGPATTHSSSTLLTSSPGRASTPSTTNGRRAPPQRHRRSSSFGIPRFDEFHAMPLRPYDTERSYHLSSKRYPRFTFVMDDHPIRSLEPKADRTATLLHLVAHLFGQLDGAITSNEIKTTVQGRNWVNIQHAQLLLTLHDPTPVTDPQTSIQEIYRTLQAYLKTGELELDATWKSWLDDEMARILHLGSISAPLSSLAAARRKKCLVLDLDRTLWYRSYRPFETADFVAVYHVPRKRSASSIFVSIRPGAQFLLDSLAPFYDIVVFTASDRKCTDDLIDLVDSKRHIQYRFYRDLCAASDEKSSRLTKDVALLGRPLSDIVIVDDNPKAWATSRANVILCKEYTGSKRDVEMYSVTHQLLELHGVDDVRPHLRAAAAANIQVA